MRKIFIILFSVLLVVVGGILLGAAIVKGSLGSEDNKVEQSYDFEDAISDITIDGNTSNINFYKATDGKCKVICIESEKRYHEVSVNNNTLTIKEIDETKWYMQAFSFSTYKREVKIYLPNDTYNSLNIKNDTGDINIPSDFTFSNIDIAVSTGDISLLAKAENDIKIKTSTGKVVLNNVECKALSISTSTGRKELTNVKASEDIKLSSSTGKTKLNSISCKNLEMDTDTGDISLVKVIASGNITITASTGDVSFDESDGDTIKVKTSTGDVLGNILTAKSFYAHSSSGKVNVPKTTGNICEIETSTGRISITITGE